MHTQRGMKMKAKELNDNESVRILLASGDIVEGTVEKLSEQVFIEERRNENGSSSGVWLYNNEKIQLLDK